MQQIFKKDNDQPVRVCVQVDLVKMLHEENGRIAKDLSRTVTCVTRGMYTHTIIYTVPHTCDVSEIQIYQHPHKQGKKETKKLTYTAFLSMFLL